MALVVVESEAGELADRLDGVEVLDVELLLEAPDQAVRRLEDGDVEPLLAAEVVIDHPLGGARLVGDLVDPRTGVALVGELAGRHGEDVGAGPLGVPGPLSAAAAGGRAHGADSDGCADTTLLLIDGRAEPRTRPRPARGHPTEMESGSPERLADAARMWSPQS